MTDPVTSFASSSVVTHGLIAGFGALTHAINAHRKGETKGFIDFCLLTIMSSFSGVIFALVALHLFENQYITLAAAGSGGFIGVEGLALLSPKIRDILLNLISILGKK